jgi:hypothetical protein
LRRIRWHGIVLDLRAVFWLFFHQIPLCWHSVPNTVR